MASILDKLKFTSVAKGTSGTKANPALKARGKFIAQLAEQTKALQAAKGGKEYRPTGKRYVERGGVRVAENVPKRMRTWWFQQGSKFYTHAYYGTTPIKFGDHNAIEAGDELGDVENVYSLLMQATEAGELDEALGKASARRSRKGDGEGAQPEQQPRSRRTAR